MEAAFVKEQGVLDAIASGAVASGEVILAADGRASVALGLQAKASGDPVAYATEGQFALASASDTLFAAGAPVFWDASANLAVTAATADLAAGDFYCGPAVVAKASGDLVVQVDLNVGSIPLVPIVVEFDCQTGVDDTTHTLIPAAMNPRGLLILGVYGRVSEQFAGTEDQGVVTIKDTAGTPNTIGTLTPSDAGADDVGDIIAGSCNVVGAATGTAAVSVAAGLGVTGAVTTPTTGSAAGKMKVYILAVPLA